MLEEVEHLKYLFQWQSSYQNVTKNLLQQRQKNLPKRSVKHLPTFFTILDDWYYISNPSKSLINILLVTFSILAMLCQNSKNIGTSIHICE